MRRTRSASGLTAIVLLGSVLAAGASLPALAADDGQALIAAAQDGLDGQVKTLLAHHANVRAADSAGSTALAWAVLRGNGAIAAALLEAKADPNQLDANHVTPFMLAIDNGDAQMVRQLLAAGADPNLARAGGETPLMLAVHYGDSDIVRQLLEARADVNAREESFGQTALMMAAGRPGLVRMLLDHHADLTPVTKNWEVKTTIYTPVTITLGVTGIPWNNDGTYLAKAGGFNALMFAVQAGDLESAKMLLDAGMDVNAAAADGTTPLLTALYSWRYADSRTPPAARFGSRGTLKFASNIEMANLLLDRGARVKGVADAAGYSPLHGAVLGMMTDLALGQASFIKAYKAPDPEHEADSLALVKRLLAAGADPNLATLYPTGGVVGDVRVNPLPPGSTPFHAAAMVKSGKLADMLAGAGGDPNRLRQDGHTPFSIAAKYDNLPAVQSMVAHGADLKKIYNDADQIPDPVLSKTEPRKDQTVLHIAASGGASAVAEYLIHQRVPAGAKNDHGETALELADKQELFRWRYIVEGAGGVSLKPNEPRNFDTTNAMRRALGMKEQIATSTVASNAAPAEAKAKP